MCKTIPLQHNGIGAMPENILRYNDGGRLVFKDRHIMQHLALDLGYAFFLHNGCVFASSDSHFVAKESEVFQAALPMCKSKSLNALKTIPIAIAA